MATTTGTVEEAEATRVGLTPVANAHKGARLLLLILAKLGW